MTPEQIQVERDRLLTLMAPEELPVFFAEVLRSCGVQAEARLMAAPDAALRLVTLVRNQWGDEIFMSDGCPGCDGFPVHVDGCEVAADLRAISETTVQANTIATTS